MLWLELFYNQYVLKIIWRLFGVDQSICNRSYFEQKRLNNIKEIYQHAGKCDYEQNRKDIIDVAMVYNPEGITDENYSLPMTKKTAKKTKC